ncbi:MAG: alpha/beta fold hydrolase [Pseudomonadota bacterium]
MAWFERDGCRIHYEVVGDEGPWIVLTPGGRGSLEDVRYLALACADKGYRVLLHDRRNCGKSDVYVAGGLSEQEIWADDVHALLTELEALPVIAGGGSAGCRLSLLLAIRYPGAVAGLLLWWVTGGRHAAEYLGEQYYGQFIDMARAGGMAAVCKSDFFSERIRDNPGNRERLLGMDPKTFINTMRQWQQFFLAGADLPVIGASREQLASIGVPTCIVPGSDEVHPRAIAVSLSEILPASELHYPFAREETAQIRVLPVEEIMALFRERLAGIFTGYLARTRF